MKDSKHVIIQVLSLARYWRLGCFMVSFVLVGVFFIYPLLKGPKLISTLKHDTWVSCLTFSPDGLVLASSAETSPHDDQRRGVHTVKLWDVVSGKERAILKHDAKIHNLAFSSDGKTLATVTGGTIHLWDVATGKEGASLKHDGVIGVTFNPKGQTLASWYNAGKDGRTPEIKLWNSATTKEIVTLKDPNLGSAVVFTSDGKLLSTSEDGIMLWDTDTGKASILLDHAKGMRSKTFSLDGQFLAAVSSDSTIHVWNLVTKQEQVITKQTYEGRGELAISRDGRTLAWLKHVPDPLDMSGEYDVVKLWDVVNDKELATCTPTTSVFITPLTFSPNSRIIAAGGGFGSIFLWKVPADK